MSFEGPNPVVNVHGYGVHHSRMPGALRVIQVWTIRTVTNGVGSVCGRESSLSSTVLYSFTVVPFLVVLYDTILLPLVQDLAPL